LSHEKDVRLTIVYANLTLATTPHDVLGQKIIETQNLDLQSDSRYKNLNPERN